MADIIEIVGNFPALEDLKRLSELTGNQLRKLVQDINGLKNIFNESEKDQRLLTEALEVATGAIKANAAAYGVLDANLKQSTASQNAWRQSTQSAVQALDDAATAVRRMSDDQAQLSASSKQIIDSMSQESKAGQFLARQLELVRAARQSQASAATQGVNQEGVNKRFQTESVAIAVNDRLAASQRMATASSLSVADALARVAIVTQDLSLKDQKVIGATGDLSVQFQREVGALNAIAVAQGRVNALKEAAARVRTGAENDATRLGIDRLQGLGPLATSSLVRVPTTTAPAAQQQRAGFDPAAMQAFLSGPGDAQLLKTVSGIQGLVGAVSILKNTLGELTREAISFNKQILAIQTISQDAKLSSKEWADELTRVASAFNIDRADAAAATYEIVSQQVGQGAEALRVFAEAAQLAQVTQTSATNAAKAITSTINAFGLTAKDAGTVAAGLFKTVELGSVQLDELGNSIGRTGTVGRELGIGLNETLAAIQAITIQGNNFRDSQTQLLNIENQLLKPTDALSKLFRELGFVNGQSAVQSIGLKGVLVEISKAVGDDAAKLKEFLPDIRALRGGVALSGEGLRFFVDDLEKTNKELSGLSTTYENAKKLFAGDPLEQATISFKTFENDVLTSFIEKLKLLTNVANDALKGLVLLAGGGDVGKEKARGEQVNERLARLRQASNFQLAQTKGEITPKIQAEIEQLQFEQQTLFKLRDVQVQADHDRIQSIKNLANVRISELERSDRKQQASIDKAQELANKAEATQKAIADRKAARQAKEDEQEAARRFRTPSDLAFKRSQDQSLFGLTDEQVNAELNRRGIQATRLGAASTDRTKLQEQLANPDLFLPDSGSVERARALFEKIKEIAEKNAEEEIDKVHEKRKAEFDARLALQNVVNNQGSQDQIQAAEDALNQATRQRVSEEQRHIEFIKERDRVDKENIETEKQLVELAKKRVQAQAELNIQAAKTKDAKDAIDELSKLKIFDKKGEFQFENQDAARSEIERLKARVFESSNDKEIRQRAEDISKILLDQAKLQQPISSRAADQANLAKALKSVNEATEAQAIDLSTLVGRYENLHDTLQKVIEDFGQLSAGNTLKLLSELARNDILRLAGPGAKVGRDLTQDVKLTPGEKKAFEFLPKSLQDQFKFANPRDLGQSDKLIQELAGRKVNPEAVQEVDASLEEFKKQLDRINNLLDKNPAVAKEVAQKLQGFARGDVNSRDTQLALKQVGEATINASDTQRFFPRLVSINNGLDPAHVGSSVKIGNVNMTVNGVNDPQQIADGLVDAMKTSIRRGLLRR